jgi:hypothetical protein
MRVYRLHIRPDAGVNSFEYCLKQQVLGVGWQVHVKPRDRLTWDKYEEAASKRYSDSGELSRVRYLHDNVKPNDLIWTRDTAGKYYLARVRAARGKSRADSAWEYLDTPLGREADIANVVRCQILPLPQVDDVTGKIVACFRPSRTIQSISDETTVLYSQLLWNQLSGTEKYKLPHMDWWDIFSFLDAENTEDLIFIYLQCQGWIVVPNSRKLDTMAYEFIAIHKKTRERAIVQVKTGQTRLATDTWGDYKEKVFLFQAHGHYIGTPTANVVQIAPKTIERFMTSQIEIMPNSISRWIEFAAKMNLSGASGLH